MTVVAIPRLLTVADVAERASLSAWTIRKEIKDGRLRARHVRGAVRVVDEDFAVWARELEEVAS